MNPRIVEEQDSELCKETPKRAFDTWHQTIAHLILSKQVLLQYLALVVQSIPKRKKSTLVTLLRTVKSSLTKDPKMLQLSETLWWWRWSSSLKEKRRGLQDKEVRVVLRHCQNSLEANLLLNQEGQASRALLIVQVPAEAARDMRKKRTTRRCLLKSLMWLSIKSTWISIRSNRDSMHG